MIVYTIIMYIFSFIFALLATLIRKGNVSLINCYREERVKDKAAYCLKIGQSLFIIAAAMFVSGVISMFAQAETGTLVALGVLMIGVFVGTVRLLHVQNKYGGGVF